MLSLGLDLRSRCNICSLSLSLASLAMADQQQSIVSFLNKKPAAAKGAPEGGGKGQATPQTKTAPTKKKTSDSDGSKDEPPQKRVRREKTAEQLKILTEHWDASPTKPDASAVQELVAKTSLSEKDIKVRAACRHVDPPPPPPHPPQLHVHVGVSIGKGGCRSIDGAAGTIIVPIKVWFQKRLQRAKQRAKTAEAKKAEEAAVGPPASLTPPGLPDDEANTPRSDSDDNEPVGKLKKKPAKAASSKAKAPQAKSPGKTKSGKAAKAPTNPAAEKLASAVSATISKFGTGQGLLSTHNNKKIQSTRADQQSTEDVPSMKRKYEELQDAYGGARTKGLLTPFVFACTVHDCQHRTELQCVAADDGTIRFSLRSHCAGEASRQVLAMHSKMLHMKETLRIKVIELLSLLERTSKGGLIFALVSILTSAVASLRGWRPPNVHGRCTIVCLCECVWFVGNLQRILCAVVLARPGRASARVRSKCKILSLLGSCLVYDLHLNLRLHNKARSRPTQQKGECRLSSTTLLACHTANVCDRQPFCPGSRASADDHPSADLLDEGFASPVSYHEPTFARHPADG